METTTKGKSELGQPTGETQTKGQGPVGTPAVQTGHTAGGGAQHADNQHSETNRGAEIVDQTKQVLTDAYETTSRAVSEAYGKSSKTVNATYQQAMDYGRENPGTLTLIAFGAGIGVGLLLAGSFNSRSRTGHIVPPVMDALSNVVSKLFR